MLYLYKKGIDKYSINYVLINFLSIFLYSFNKSSCKAIFDGMRSVVRLINWGYYYTRGDIMRVGIIGPSERIEKVKKVVKEEFDNIEPVDVCYTLYPETPDLVRHYQPLVDAFLFCGTAPYTFTRTKVIPAVPWEYIPQHGSSLLRALLEAVMMNKYNILNVSFDSYNSSLLLEAYDEIGIPREKLNVFFANVKPFEENYLNYVYSFHKECFYKGKTACCATALFSVYEQLKKEKIPCLLIHPTKNIIRESLQKLQFKYLAEVNKQSQIVALRIQIDLPDEYSMLNENEYQHIMNRMKAAEQVYLFAEKIKAAVIEVSFREYLLFSTRKFIEIETNNFHKLDLIRLINMNTLNTASIGIGYGETAIEAKQNASFGMSKASKRGGNMAYVVFNKKNIIGPIKSDMIKGAEEDSVKVDEKLFKISEDTGISINTIFKLYNIVEKYKKNSYTSGELAKIYGITSRSMNRIIEKLELSGYCKIVGKKVISDAGRPSRIIKFELS